MQADHEITLALDRVDPASGAFITVDSETVRSQAASVSASGRLAGVVIAVKDLIDTAGIRTTYGSAIFADHVPQSDAPIVSAMRAEGAVIVGKTNLNEFAFGGSGYNQHFGPILKPQDYDRTAGGSSGGSAAAVASGVCRLAIGTDTSGSCRGPAACCGVYGMKLANMGAALEGVYPVAPSYDSIGFLAKDVSDLQLALDIRELPDVKDLRVARVGADIEVPTLTDHHWTVFRNELRGSHTLLHRHHAEDYGRELRRALEGLSDGGDVDMAKAHLADWRMEFLRLTAEVDVLVSPVIDGEAPTVANAIVDHNRDGASLIRDRMVRHTAIYNELGWPALAAPTPQGSVQIAGRPGREPALLAVAKSLRG